MRFGAACLMACMAFSLAALAQESPDSVLQDEMEEGASGAVKPLELKAAPPVPLNNPVEAATPSLGSPDRPSVMSMPQPAIPVVEGAIPATPADAAAPVESEAPAVPKTELFRSAKLRALNKVTARYGSVTAPLGMLVRFGNLEIIAQRCQTDEVVQGVRQQSALVDIWELKPNEKPARVFHGWLFADSPSLSSMNHAVYDVGLDQCMESETPPE